MRTFLFLALRRPDLTARLARAAVRTGATVVLDLEDALWDPDDPAKTAALKVRGRATLEELAATGTLAAGRFGVRINGMRSLDAQRDLEAIGRAREGQDLDCVFVPKVETADEVEACRDELERRRIGNQEIVPIIETRWAMERLPKLLAALRRAGVQRVVYGIFDLALDSGWWPFPEPDDAAEWRRIESFIRQVEDAAMLYVHPPFVRASDDTAMARLIGRLETACQRDFGVLTVTSRQAAAASRAAEDPRRVPFDPVVPTTVDPVAAARRVLAAYRAHRRPDASFAFDPATGDFIAPHMYLAASRYLAERGLELDGQT